MQPRQLPLFAEAPTRPFNYPFPTTRYQGSKRTLVDWIWNAVGNLSFDSVLDAFGGTGVVSHMFKNAGKRVVYNDILRFNWNFALALIENRSVKLCDEDVELVLSHTPPHRFPTSFNPLSGTFTSLMKRTLGLIARCIT